MKKELTKGMSPADKMELLTALLKDAGLDINHEELIALQEKNAGNPELAKIYDKFSLKKKVFISGYLKSFGNVSKASLNAKITRKTYYDWREADPGFAEYIDSLQAEDVRTDLYEAQLDKLAFVDEDTAATIFYLKTKGRHRGYVERNEIVPPPTEENNVHYFLPDNGRGDTKDVTHEEIQPDQSKESDNSQ